MYIRTQQLEMKPMSPGDVAALTVLLTDDKLGKTYMVPDFSSPAEAVKLAQRLIDLSHREDRYVAGIYRGEGLIGILNETEVADNWIEVGYAILPQYHNQGYCTEALGGAIGYFYDHGFREVLAGAFAENLASIRVMEKNGMEKLSRTDEIAYRGRVYRCVYYSAKK